MTNTKIDKVFATMEKRIGGLDVHVRRVHVASPQDFLQRFGLSSRVPPLLLPEGVELPMRDPNTGVYLLGSAVYPSSPNIFGTLKSVGDAITAAYANLGNEAVQRNAMHLRG